MPTDDPANHRRRLQREQELLAEAPLTDQDRDAIQDFLDYRSSQDSVRSLVNYSSVLRKAAERCHCPMMELDDLRDARSFFRELRTNPEWGRGGPMATSTVGTYMEYTRQLLDFHDREWAEDIEPDRPDDDERAVNPNDMLSQTEIQEMIEHADRQRDVAQIEFLSDTGARIGMLASLRVKDVDLDGEKATYTPNDEAIGLKGAPIKEYPIIDARAAMRTYLRQSHPRPDRGGVAFFHAFNGHYEPHEDGAITPNGLADRLRRIARDAGIEKPTNPHNWKHSAVTRMAREGYSKQQIQHRVHWDVDTDMWDTYIHLAADEVNDDIFAEAGIIDAEEGSDRVRHPCGNCGHELAPHHRHCPQCGAPATQPRRALLEALDERLVEAIVNADSEALRQRLADLRRYAKRNPVEVPDIVDRLFPDEDFGLHE